MNPILALVISGAIGFGIFFGTAELLWDIFRSKPLSWIAGVSVGLSAAWLIFHRLYDKSNARAVDVLSGAAQAVKRSKDQILKGSSESDSDLYAIADSELNSGNMDKGAWAIALVNADGNEEKRKSEYLKLRVKQLKQIAN